MTAQVIQLRTSRQFLIQQAVLNALAKNFPFGMEKYGAGETLRKLETGNAFQMAFFTECVLMEFRKLKCVYHEADDDLGPGYWAGGMP